MSTTTVQVAELKKALLSAPPDALEHLAGELLGRLLGVQFRFARPGSQRGGDGGVQGTAGRDLIYEARRYRDGTLLRDREIRGEIDEAVERNPDLELWILITTQAVSEQTRTAMEGAARPRGVSTLILDWTPESLPTLAVLCSIDPPSVEAAIGEGHRGCLETLNQSSEAQKALQGIRSQLEPWTVGFELLRRLSHERVRDIWQCPSTAMALFNQNVAGGANPDSHVGRATVVHQLDSWNADEENGPALVTGSEGMGKTWAAIDWVQSRLESLPIVVLVPSSSLSSPITTRPELTAFIARLVQDLNPEAERDQAFWVRRVSRLLCRPAEEGQVFLLYFDGLNEQPSLDWPAVFNRLQDEVFGGRTRILASARKTFVSERMGDFHNVYHKPIRLEVGPYDMAPGSEFDRKLAAEGLLRADFPESLHRLASVPRMFDLVVQLRDRFGAVEGVTLHRLLWEYGASAIVASTFGPSRWREFILDLAAKYLERSQPRWRDVEQFSAGAASTPDQIYARVSTVVDSVFAHLDRDGDLTFEPDFVHHSLGLALVKTLESTPHEEPREKLDGFLQPLGAYDEAAEILRAAISITLARQSQGQRPSFLGALCTSWVQTQNLPGDHLAELGVLAHELVEPLLEAVERSPGPALSSPRYIAVNALATVDKRSPTVARTIASLASRWQRVISLERARDSTDRTENSEYTWRRNLLEERIGTAEVGSVFVLGTGFEIVEDGDPELPLVAAQLLQGRPLAEAIQFLEAGAIHQAITGMPKEAQSWLNSLNVLDPVETAERLRSRSTQLRTVAPETGVHPDLPKRVAALLLWRTGYEEDARSAAELNPPMERPLSYEEAYLSDPAASVFYPLERRHVVHALARQDLPARYRVNRAEDALVDPSFPVPDLLAAELVTEVEALNFDEVNTGTSRTREDLLWSDLSLGLARCAPEELARIERQRMRGYSQRSGQARFAAAMATLDAMLLVTEGERVAMRRLRGDAPEGMDNYEWTAQTNLLMVEVQGQAPLVQIQSIIDSGLDSVHESLARACGTPSIGELDELVVRNASPPHLATIAQIVGEREMNLSEKAFDAFSGLIRDEHPRLELEPVWLLLGLNAPKQLGAVLEDRRWKWSADKPYFENTMGSRAVAAANEGKELSEIAGRLYPSTLLAVVAKGHTSQEDVALAVSLLDGVVLDAGNEVPESPLQISYDRSSAEESRSYLYTCAGLRAKDQDDRDSHFWDRITSPEEYEERLRTLRQSYSSEVRRVRSLGAQFHLEFVDPRTFEPVLRHCPQAVDRWLEGMDSRSQAFCRRIHLANGFYVSLCEALLSAVPVQGVALWRALRECQSHVKFTVHGDMDRLVHALVCAAQSPEVDDALKEIHAVQQSRSDRELSNLLVGARLSGRLDWLRQTVERDAGSPCPLHRWRGAFLEPQLRVPPIAGSDAWPEGRAYWGPRETAWKLAQREAFAKHWLQAFSQAQTPEGAHAAWRLFLACVDRRALSWMDSVLDQHSTPDLEFAEAKGRFLRQQAERLRRAMADNESHWSDNFAGKRYPKALKPWNARL